MSSSTRPFAKTNTIPGRTNKEIGSDKTRIDLGGGGGGGHGRFAKETDDTLGFFVVGCQSISKLEGARALQTNM